MSKVNDFVDDEVFTTQEALVIQFEDVDENKEARAD